MPELQGKTYPCIEYGVVQVPITDVIIDGQVELFPEVTNKGYFDIDFRGGQLVVTAKNFIGTIPINQRVNIHVTPRFPIDNVLYLVQKARSSLRFLPGHLRGYKLERLASGHAEDFFARSLLDCLIDVQRNGLMRRYESRIVERGWRGRILLAPTVTRFISKGDRCHHVRDVSELSVDIDENKFIKRLLVQLTRFFLQNADTASRDVARRSARLLQLFDRVSSFSDTPASIARDVPAYIKRLPGDHKSYEQVLWLCFLIATRQGISIETFGPARIESLIINLADVFEDYIRRVIREGLHVILPGCQLRDGNTHQVPLFVQNEIHKLKPDMYLINRGRTIAVLDAKYKPAVKAADRYEILAFCEALQAKCAIFLSPTGQSTGSAAFIGRTPGGIEMHEVRIALSASDILDEENKVLDGVRGIVESATAIDFR